VKITVMEMGKIMEERMTAIVKIFVQVTYFCLLVLVIVRLKKFQVGLMSPKGFHLPKKI
jgi:hypothetical protein